MNRVLKRIADNFNATMNEIFSDVKMKCNQYHCLDLECKLILSRYLQIMRLPENNKTYDKIIDNITVINSPSNSLYRFLDSNFDISAPLNLNLILNNYINENHIKITNECQKTLYDRLKSNVINNIMQDLFTYILYNHLDDNSFDDNSNNESINVDNESNLPKDCYELRDNIMNKINTDKAVIDKLVQYLMANGCPSIRDAYFIISDFEGKYYRAHSKLMKMIAYNNSVQFFGIDIPKLVKDEWKKCIKSYKSVNIKILQHSFEDLLKEVCISISVRLGKLAEKLNENISAKVYRFKRK